MCKTSSAFLEATSLDSFSSEADLAAGCTCNENGNQKTRCRFSSLGSLLFIWQSRSLAPVSWDLQSSQSSQCTPKTCNSFLRLWPVYLTQND